MFKTKIDPEKLSNMTYKDYVSHIKLEVKKAKKFGQSDVVILSNFKFSCETVSTMMILSKFSGPIAKWYKKIKRERKLEKDYARGTCYFRENELGVPILNIAIQEGKGKPAKMQKNGKSLFKRLGLSPDIFKGEFVEGGENSLSQDEIEEMDDDADDLNDNQRLAPLANKYKKAFKIVVEQVVPEVKNQTKLNAKYLEATKKAYILCQSFVERYDESGVSQKDKDRFAEFYAKAAANVLNLRKLVAKVKQILMKQAKVKGETESVVKQLSKEEVTKQLNEKKTAITSKLQALDDALKLVLGIR